MERRDELLAACRRYFLRHGVANLSLRPLAAEAGTSARLLVYHFGSKDGLIAAVMDEVQARAQRSFAASAAQAPKTRKGLMRAFWTWITHPSNVPTMRLLFEVQALALQNPAVVCHSGETTLSAAAP